MSSGVGRGHLVFEPPRSREGVKSLPARKVQALPLAGFERNQLKESGGYRYKGVAAGADLLRFQMTWRQGRGVSTPFYNEEKKGELRHTRSTTVLWHLGKQLRGAPS